MMMQSRHVGSFRRIAAAGGGVFILFAAGAASGISQSVASQSHRTAGTGTAGPSVAPDPPKPGVTPSTTLPIDPHVLQVQEELNKFVPALRLVGDGDAAFAGVGVDPIAGLVNVYRTRVETSVPESAYKALVLGASIQFPLAILSAKDVAVLNKRVSDNSASLSAQGIVVQRWGQDHYDKPFVIMYNGVDNGPPPAQLTSLFSDFSRDLVQFAYGTEDAASGRGSDIAPFYGGAAINFVLPPGGSVPNECSSGFAVKSTANGDYYMLTAWHCYNPADPRVWAELNYSWVNATELGRVTNSLSQYDVAYVKTTNQTHGSAPFIYAGTNGNDNVDAAVGSLQSPISGNLVCSSGSVLKLVCAGQFTGPRQWQVVNPYSNVESQVINGWSIDPAPGQSNGSALISRGDSGGPVFSYDANHVAHPRGLLSAAPGSAQVACPSFVQGRICYNTADVVDIAPIVTGEQNVITGFH